jgi:subtilase family serine protease
VDETSLTTLKGNVTPLVRAANDRGEAAPATQMQYIRLVLSRSTEQETALEELMAEQLDKNSPNYQKWLTPEQFGKIYGPADSDVAAIVAWLQSHGLTVEDIPPGRTNIPFSGSVSHVEEAFHTSIHSFEMRGQQFYANTADPQIPSALAAVVSGVARLNTYEPQPHLAASRPGLFDPQVGHFTAGEHDNMLARPEFTTTTQGDFLWSVPADAATIYDTPNAFNAAFSSGTSYTGQGVTIGIAGDAAIQASTVVSFRKRFLNGDSTAPTITNVGNSAVAGLATDEAYIDTELAGGLAPGATIHFYTSNDLIVAIQQALTDNTVDILSVSFGECEYHLTSSDNSSINALWKQAATQGIAVTVSTGDDGSAGCDNQNSTTVYMASGGLQVNGLASTPYNIAVGGTDYYGLKSGFSTYVNTNQSSSNFYRSALKYIPEATWNDSTSVNGELANNAPLVLSDGHTHFIGGSGGVSACSTNTDTASTLGTCTSGYAKPTWQRGAGVPNDGARDLPDVSMMAGNGIDAATWLVCTDDPYSTTTFVENCTTQSDSNFYFAGYGGTSTSAPAFAGILALVQEKMGGGGVSHRLGSNAAKTLYDLYNGSHASAVFHDVTQGNISVLCTSGTPNCSKNTAGNFYLTGYDTGTGYDLATGLGSVDATQLINFWGASTGGGAATITATPTSTSITTAQTDSIAVTVAGSGGTPTGTVTLTGGGYTSSAQTLVAGAFTFNLAAGALAVGTDTLTVTYSGDSNFASTTKTTTVTVTKASPTVTATPTSASITTAQTDSVAVTVTGSGSTPTGTVTLTGGGYTSPAQTLASGDYTFSLAAGALAAGTDQMTVTYSGDSNYAGATGTTTVTVTKASATVTAQPSSATFPANQAITVTATVSGSGPTPTGTVSLSGGGYTASAQQLSSGTYKFSIPASSLSVGTDTLTVSYSGDSIYSANTVTTSVKVTTAVLVPTMTVTPGSNSINVTQSLSVAVKVTGTGATPTGTVALTGGGYSSGAQTLSGGSYTFAIAAGKLATGTDTLTVTYSGDTNYAAASGTGSVTVSLLTASVTVKPANSGAIVSSQPEGVTVSVTGGGPTPTGSITISGGGYTSLATNLSGGSATVTIPPGTFINIGTVALTANYSGDAVYATGSGTANLTVASPVSGSASVPSAVAAGSSATSTITWKADASYSGTLAVSCIITNSPSGATDKPNCSISAGSSVTITGGTAGGTSTATVTTTAAQANLERPGLPGWAGPAGGTALAMLLLFGIPARRRRLLKLLGIVVLLAALGSFSACGGGGGGGTKDPGTTAGAYTFTVTGAANPTITPSPSVTFTVNVN